MADRVAAIDAGSVIEGFRIERLLGRGSLGPVYEATQLSLGRSVALRLLDEDLFSDSRFAARFSEQQRVSASVHHPSLVPTYEAGEWEGGRLLATRYVRGRTLAAALEDGSVSAEDLTALLAPVAEAMEAAHEAGLVHGRITPRNVLVDARGAAHLTDLGLGHSGSAEGDRHALADMVARGERAQLRPRLRSLPALVGALALAALAAVVLVRDEAGGGAADDRPPPPVAAGAVPIGSELAAGPTRPLGCGDEPGPNTPACTLSQSTVGGQAVTVGQRGVIRSWAVRGAKGELALQVIGRRDGREFLRGFSKVERVPDGAPRAFDANVPVQRGDRIGVLLAPGAVLGAKADSPGASALRWEGTLDFKPRPHSPSRISRELLLRVDLALGARLRVPQLTGSRAATAPDGRPLGEAVIHLSARRAVRVVLVRTADAVAVDAFRGSRRRARIEVPDADPHGRVLAFDGHCGYKRGLCLRWLNEGAAARPVIHAYRLTRGGRAFRVIG